VMYSLTDEGRELVQAVLEQKQDSRV
jgi:DNA-binding PadR family transcriptional regulator